MLTFFRRVSKSKVGTWIMAAVLIAILAGFAISDISNFGSGKIGLGMGSSTLAKAGGQEVEEREMSDAMQRRLQQARQQNPAADYATVLGDFEKILGALIDSKALAAFAEKYDFHLSKRLVDAGIAEIPQARGLNGQFSDQAYRAFLAQQRMSDTQVRQIIGAGLLEQLLLAPVGANPRISVGQATPYASMLLEAREGEATSVPIDAFKAGLNPTDSALQAYYSANRARYMVPEQRSLRLARVGPEQVAHLSANDQEIAAYYNANRASYAARDTRTLSQAVVPDQATAAAIAARARGGATLSAAAAPAGANAAVTTASDQTKSAYASAAGDKVAEAAFGAAQGAVVGPIQSDFGWVVVKVEAVKTVGGKTLDQARSEIADKVTAEKRKQAIEDIVDGLQNAVDDGSNFAEAAAKANLAVTTTPLVQLDGTSRSDAAYRFPEPLKPALAPAFDIAANDPPEIVTLPKDQGYVMVSPAQVVTAAPAPLATIRDRVRADWIDGQALQRARAAAEDLARKAGGGASLAEAAKGSAVALPAVHPLAARRIQIAMAQGPVPPALRLLFSLGQGKSRVIADPQGRGFFVVKVTKIVPGNAMLQPSLIARMQNELQPALAQDYASEFMAAVRQDSNIKRNEDAINALKQRLAAGG